MNELKQKHADLIAERDALENSIPQLEAAWHNAPKNWNRFGSMIGSPESTAARDKLSEAESRLRAIPGKLELIEQKLAYVERCARVEQAKSESLQIMSDSAATVEALERTRAHLTERFQAIQTESEQALDKAQQAERDAASFYARSLASGDTEGEKAANNEIQKAAKQLATTDEQVRRQELILDALQAELDSIENQITTIQQQSDEARKAALSAIGLALGEEWNAVVKQLAVVGSQILAVSYQQGGWGYALPSFDVPRFGPSASSLRREDLERDAHGISLKDLLTA
ncbi:hypothetical protein [Pseudomonas rubra]|uniref:Chromosome segregation protein SMC n=1 Tax=Pseudomonas rubra TaxID=2942627 RepID=A0ABT5P8C5_9PSED|nr:hypothetical protein [Pseudomonas rubra]MDD1014437.1 hypothetical protein [Pseudomonas rubra]MDD1037940.1 hypothetical protein [Pseudomonas rubra]MDD1155373.1 hypothetical protein [Pseudomonas rubra]